MASALKKPKGFGAYSDAPLYGRPAQTSTPYWGVGPNSPMPPAAPAAPVKGATPTPSPAMPQPASQPAPSQPASQPKQQQGGIDFSGINFDDDPIVARVKALNQQLVSNAQATALANKKRALIDFGSPELVTQLLGGKEGATAEAAKQNPFSTLAQLLTGHQQSQLGIDEQMNKRNLFYSTARSTAMSDEQKGYLLQQAQAQTDLDTRIASYNQAVLDAQDQAAQQLLQAQEEAYGRALQIALANAAAASAPQYGPPAAAETPPGAATPTATDTTPPPGYVVGYLGPGSYRRKGGGPTFL